MLTRDEFTDAVKTAHAYLGSLDAKARDAASRLSVLETARDQRQSEVDGLAAYRARELAALDDEMDRHRRSALNQLDHDLLASQDRLEAVKVEITDCEARAAGYASLRRTLAELDTTVRQLDDRKRELTGVIDRLTERAKGLGDTVQALEARKATLDAALAAARASLG